MSWSDDIRCLHCDGRLPLYRKITHGQFCSSAHRKAYWQEQERLAVERLHQTHDSLRALSHPELPFSSHVLTLAQPESVALIPWSATLSAASVKDPVQPGLLSAGIEPRPNLGPSFIATDPFEYEMDLAPRHPDFTASADPGAQWPIAGIASWHAEPEPRPLAAGQITAFSIPYWNERDSNSPRAIAWPRATAPLSPIPDYASLLEIPTQRWTGPWNQSAPFQIASVEPLPLPLRAPQRAALALPPASDILDRLFDRLPRADRLLTLAPPPAFELQTNAPVLASLSALPIPERAVRNSLATTVPSRDYQLGAAPRVSLPVSRGRVPEKAAPRVKLRSLAFELRASQSGLQAFSLTGGAPTLELPFAAGIRYPVRSCAVTVSPVPMAPGLRPAKFEGALAIPALLVGVGDSGANWVAPPAPKLALVLRAQAAPAFEPMNVASFPQPLQTAVCRPVSRLEPLEPRTGIEVVAPPMPNFEPHAGASLPAEPFGKPQPVPSTMASSAMSPSATTMDSLNRTPWFDQAAGFWNHAPRDLKLLLCSLPVMVALALHPSLPIVRVSASAPTAGIGQVLETQLASFRQSMSERAAVALDEDFRGGLDDWNSRGGDTTDWSYDATGFVKPGPLALYGPSQQLSDYHLQFFGMIGKKSLSWVVRAADFDNYYVVKLMERKGGPLPEMVLTRYAVIGGKAQDRVDTPVPISARPDMLYLVRMELDGNNFALWVQDQMVDNWADPRLRRGGVGFFSARGEESRIRWVQITHQYDMLGRLCAYLAPYNLSSN